MQEMNLARFYGTLYWKVACLCVQAGIISDEIEGSPDYGAMAKAIGGMEKGFVTPPYINEARVGFTPDKEHGTCIFGLGAISGINSDLARQLMALRPFVSFEDFIEKCIDTKIVQPSKMYNLIKAGCFDRLIPDRVEVMVRFINHLVPDKSKLTASNIPKLCSYGIVPKELQPNIWLQEFRKQTFNKSNCVTMINKTHGIYKVPVNLTQYFYSTLEKDFIEAMDYNDAGELCLNSKEFEKIYAHKQAPLTKWLKSEGALQAFNYCSKNEVWMKYCTGSLAKWEMDSVCYYSNEHELEPMHLEQFYNIDNFRDMPTVPETYLYTNPRTKKQYTRNKLSIIAGTVVDKNKSKKMITLNTTTGIVEVKLHKDVYTKFDKKVEGEASWFTRGNKLLVVGFRRGESFVPRTYSDSPYSSSIMKAEITPSGRVEIKRERVFESEDVAWL